jgi:hypothetical protein
MSQLDAMRDKLLAKAKEAASRNRGNEFTPDFGTTMVRLLPQKDPEDVLPYFTHAYHYLPIDGGKYVYTPRKFKVGGTDENPVVQIDPIDEAVARWYQQANITKNDKLKSIAGTIKRKRHFFFQCIVLDEPDPEKKFKILVDRSNDGKLAKVICRIMGIPFFKDVQDNFVDQSSTKIDPDADYYDLMDIEEGHDLKIKKVQDGVQTWDISYTDSLAIKKARPLDKDERVLLEKRIDLKTYIKYETDYEVVNSMLKRFMETMPAMLENFGEEVAKAPVEEQKDMAQLATEIQTKKAVSKPKKVYSDDDIEEMLDELDK